MMGLYSRSRKISDMLLGSTRIFYVNGCIYLYIYLPPVPVHIDYN